MVVMLPKFNQIVVTWCKKFKPIFDEDNKQENESNDIYTNNWQESKFYNALDKWYHQDGQIMYHVPATTTYNVEF